MICGEWLIVLSYHLEVCGGVWVLSRARFSTDLYVWLSVREPGGVLESHLCI